MDGAASGQQQATVSQPAGLSEIVGGQNHHRTLLRNPADHLFHDEGGGEIQA